MNKKTLTLAIAVCFTLMAGCANNSDKDKETTTDEAVTSESASAPTETPTPNQPKSYTAVFSPDSAILGKSNEALVKITGASAVALTDPDGKDKGIEFVVKLQVTNRGQIGEGGSISVSYEDARLQLDNGTSMAASTGTDYLRAQPEATSNIESWTFTIPAGAKPTALNLFMNGTRVSTSITLK